MSTIRPRNAVLASSSRRSCASCTLTRIGSSISSFFVLFVSWWFIDSSHAEDAPGGLLNEGVEGGGEAEAEDHARIFRGDDAIIPEAGGAVVGVALALVGVQDWLHEGG